MARLNESVPEKLRSHFATAQNLLVYSWYFYPFQMAAELNAYASLEFALRERLRPGDPKLGFKDLLRQAHAMKLIADDRFELFTPRTAPSRLPKDVDAAVQVRTYVDVLIDTMPSLRNYLAHGTTMLAPNAATTLLLCADLINQLYAPLA